MAQPRSGRPHKITDTSCDLVTAEEHKNRLSLVTTLTTEFRTASGSNARRRTVRRELHEMGFHC